jgi:hypothetical protein
MGSSEFLGPARLKGCEQPTGLVVLRELRVAVGHMIYETKR